MGCFRYRDTHRPGGSGGGKLPNQKRSGTPRPRRRPQKMPSSPAFFPVFGKDRNTHNGDVEVLQQEYKSIHPTAQVF